MESYILPREQLRLPCTTSRCIRHSASTLDEARTVVIRACSWPSDQHWVGSGMLDGTLIWSYTTRALHPAVASMLTKSSVPEPASAGTACGATAP